MSKDDFQDLVAQLTERIKGRPLDAELENWLNAQHGPNTATYDALKEACVCGVADGWMCEREGGGIRYGRVLKASDKLNRYSVDVVDMREIAGPHHRHPQRRD